MTVREVVAMLQSIPEAQQDQQVAIWSAGMLHPIQSMRDVAKHSHGHHPACVQLTTWKPWTEELYSTSPPPASPPAVASKGGKP